MIQPDLHFKNFIASLEDILGAHGDNTTVRQKLQVEGLVDLEKQFRRALIRHPWGKYVYQDFIRFIMEEKRNILSARLYFRERDTVFTGYLEEDEGGEDQYVRGIADVFRGAWNAENRKVVGWRGLYRFNFNWHFIAWVMRTRKWEKQRSAGKIVKLAAEIAKARHELVEMNLPLAIAKARSFWQATPKSHLEYMDFIQIASEGLLSAIDKFVLPYATVWRTVAAYRMSGNFIRAYSETPLHFYPKDKRRLYRAHKYLKDHDAEADLEGLVKEVNRDIRQQDHVTASEITNLLSAASVVSVDALVDVVPDGDDSYSTSIEKFAAPEGSRPDVIVEEMDLRAGLTRAIHKLTMIQKKLIRLKGVQLA